MNLEDIPSCVEVLRNFEDDIALSFKQGVIHSPVHFSYGNEEQLIKIFRGLREEDFLQVSGKENPAPREELIRQKLIEVNTNVKKNSAIFQGIKHEDWICTSYRSHYHALLKGMPKELVKNEILEGRSMYLINSSHRLITTAIVAGQFPIAVGIAKGLKLKGSLDRVWAFCGDMASETGIFDECTKYAEAHNLPLTFVIEDNGLSVDTPTYSVWNTSPRAIRSNTIQYTYKSGVPHQGIGKEVGF